jgi:hypothetical protein
MKKIVFVAFLFCSVVASFTHASGDVALDLLPASQTVAVGEPVTVELVVSGLTQGGAPSVDYFDIDVSYGDPGNVLSFANLEFGPFLGDPSDPAETSVSFFDSPGQFVGMSENSLLQASALHALQPSEFPLATLTFTANSEGSTILSGDLYVLQDTSGAALIHTFGPVGSASVTVVAASSCAGSAAASVGPVGPTYGPPVLARHLGVFLFLPVVGLLWVGFRRTGVHDILRDLLS